MLQIKFLKRSLTRVMQKIVVYYVVSKVNIFCFASSAGKDMYLIWGKRKTQFRNLVFRKMDEEDSIDGMDDEESKNPLAFLGLQRFGIIVTKTPCI